MGRPCKLTDHQKREAIKRRNQGETLADIARSYNVSPETISRLRAHLDLTDEETAGLANELHRIVENDRYPFSPRIARCGRSSTNYGRSPSASSCRREGLCAAIKRP